MSKTDHLTLEHYTRHEGELHPVPDQREDQPGYGDKPIGFWVSVKGPQDWPAYLDSADLTPAPNRHVIELAKDANVLIVKTSEELAALSGRYPSLRGSCYLSGESINWAAMARDYDGIIIAKYFSEMRLSHAWYYTWDCASGCIWSPDAIMSTRLLNDSDQQEIIDIIG